tara:strand:+ start:430 stop:687 length:258 start_codon:yes stop_codon:yes gene_type:complete
MSKQTSVELLIQEIEKDQMVKSKSLNEWLEIFEQAKAMHKNEMKLELPTDEAIEKEFTMGNQIFIDRINGAKWMRDKITTIIKTK